MITHHDTLTPDAATGHAGDTALLTVPETLARLRVSRRTLATLSQRGLPTVRLGRAVRYHWPSVEQWLLRNQRGDQ